MALGQLKKELKAVIDSPDSYEIVVRLLGGNAPGFNGKYHFMEIFPSQFAQKMHLAVRDALRIHFSNQPGVYEKYLIQHKQKLSTDTFVTAIRDVINSFSQAHIAPGNSTRFYSSNRCRGMYLDSQKGATFLVYPGSNIYKRGARFRKEVFKQWKANTGHGTLQSVSTKNRDLDVAHDPSTSVWIAMVELRAEQVQAELNIKTTEFDLAQAVLENIGVTWEEEVVDGAQTIGQKRIIKVALGPDNIKQLLDAGGADTILKGITKTQKDIFFDKFWYMHPIKAFKAMASVPFREQAAAQAQYEALRLIMKKGKKAGYKVKAKKVAKPKRKNRSGKLKQSKVRTKVKTRQISIPKKISITAATEKGEGKQADTKTVAELNKLRNEINKGLTQEVIRNMGRGGTLRNRTGRFASSAKLISLHEARKTIVAKYTYLLSPYETFENTGFYRWPLAYNPKPLIAKSIRTLAKKRMETKLTVRRV